MARRRRDVGVGPTKAPLSRNSENSEFNFESSATSTKFLAPRLLSEEIQKTLNSNFEPSLTNYYPPKAFGF